MAELKQWHEYLMLRAREMKSLKKWGRKTRQIKYHNNISLNEAERKEKDEKISWDVMRQEYGNGERESIKCGLG